jgi:predicted MPP superfamily phosphohydrolase
VINRRAFIRRAARTGFGLTGATTLAAGYGFWEAAHIRVSRHTVSVPNLPPAFAGKTVAVLADLHHGPFVGLDFIREAVRLTNALAPDLVALVGDDAHKGDDARRQLPPCLDALSALAAPLGVFAGTCLAPREQHGAW